MCCRWMGRCARTLRTSIKQPGEPWLAAQGARLFQATSNRNQFVEQEPTEKTQRTHVRLFRFAPVRSSHVASPGYPRRGRGYFRQLLTEINSLNRSQERKQSEPMLCYLGLLLFIINTASQYWIDLRESLRQTFLPSAP